MHRYSKSSKVNSDYVNHLVPARGSLSANMELTIANAQDATAFAIARNDKGDQASVGVQILGGSLEGYKNSATAAWNQATASESVTSASGPIALMGTANNLEGDFAGVMLVSGGSITGYKNSVTTTRKQAKASENAKFAFGDHVIFGESASNYEGDIAGSLSLDENKEYFWHIENGGFTDLKADATSKIGSVTTSERIGSLSGELKPTLGLGEVGPRASNKWNREKSAATVALSGSLSGYNNVAYADKVSTKVTQSIITASGTIDISHNAQYWDDESGNYLGGKSSNSVSLESGSLDGYSNSASATPTKANTSQEIDAASGTIDTSSKAESGIRYTSSNALNVERESSNSVSLESGSLDGYSNSASATPTEATTSQNIKSTSRCSILAMSLNENIEGDATITGVQILNGELWGYSDNSILTPSSASSSKFINYAEGDSTFVGTSASQNRGRKYANVISMVTDGYIFLNSDRSNAARLDSTYFPNAEASADIKTFGTIDVQSSTNLLFTEPVFQRSGKLIATIDSASYIDHETIIPHEWDGLALMADESTALLGIGHVGVGIWNEDGTWTVGAIQGGNKIKLLNAWINPGFYNGGWSATGSWLEAQAYLASDNKDDLVNKNKRLAIDPKTGLHEMKNGKPLYAGNGLYDKIKVIKVDDPNYDLAHLEILIFPYRGYK